MILIITHSKDNDGHFSGAICQYFEEKLNNVDPNGIMYLRWSYGDKDPDKDYLRKFSKVYVLDLTLSLEIMDFLAKEYSGSVVWIDHHLANYSRLPEYILNQIPGDRNHENAACINTWRWWLNIISQNQEYYNAFVEFNEGVYNALCAMELDESLFYTLESSGWSEIRKHIPIWLYMIGCYDIWKWNGSNLWNKYIIPFEYFLRSDLDGPKGAYEFIRDYFDCMTYQTIPDISGFITVGRYIFKYQEKRNNSVLSNLYKISTLNETTGKKVNCLVINTLDRGSVIFNNINPDLKVWADYYILWHNTGKKYKYSAYSEKPDVFVPDLKIKGCLFGGHPHAGGCVTNKKLL